MNRGYEMFCGTDRDFYDSETVAGVEEELFAIARREVPGGWESRRTDDWLMLAPDAIRLPSQGWKIQRRCLAGASWKRSNRYKEGSCLLRKLSHRKLQEFLYRLS